MELYTKEYVKCIVTLASYHDHSVKQACYKHSNKTVEFYRAGPDVVNGSRYLRNRKFSINFNELNDIIEKIDLLCDPDAVRVIIQSDSKKRLICQINGQYGNWEMGYEKKSSTLKRKALVLNLDEEEDMEIEVMETERNTIADDYEPIEDGNKFQFKKTDNFQDIKSRLMELKRCIYQEYPSLRKETDEN